MTHQLFGVLARRKHLATPGYALHPSGIWDITLSEIFTLECDWRSRICTWRHGAQLIPVRKQHLSRDDKRSFAKGLTPARPSAYGRLFYEVMKCHACNTNQRDYQVAEDFGICLACFCPCDLELMRMGSGFGVVVPSSEECTPSNLTELCKVNEVHMKCVELICSLKIH